MVLSAVPIWKDESYRRVDVFSKVGSPGFHEIFDYQCFLCTDGFVGAFVFVVGGFEFEEEVQHEEVEGRVGVEVLGLAGGIEERRVHRHGVWGIWGRFGEVWGLWKIRNLG